MHLIWHFTIFNHATQFLKRFSYSLLSETVFRNNNKMFISTGLPVIIPEVSL